MLVGERLYLLSSCVWKLGVLIRVVLGFWFWFGVHRPADEGDGQVTGYTGLKFIWVECYCRKIALPQNYGLSNILFFGFRSDYCLRTSYGVEKKGTWKFLSSENNSSIFPDFRKSSGNSIIELVNTPTRIAGVHYIQGVIIFQDVFYNKHTIGGAQIQI